MRELLDRFILWRVRGRHFKHLKRLREKRVVLTPHHSAQRNGTQAVPH